jgi:hypothetical protein
MMRRKLIFNVLAQCLGFTLSFLAAEFCTRIFDLDIKAAWINRSVVGFADLASEVHRPSNNHSLLYDLSPGTKVRTSDVHKKELKYREATMSINSLGFRGVEFDIEKRPGVFRVFIVGSSGTFGPKVTDEDTYPAQTGAILEKKYPGQFEVINAGVTGYVLSQEVTWAREIISKYSPDLIIFHSSHSGRRPFYFRDETYAGHFKHDPELFKENIPCLYCDSEKSKQLHNFLIDNLATYRLLAGVLDYASYRFPCESPPEQLAVCLANSPLRSKYELYGDFLSAREFKDFLDDQKKTRVILFHSIDTNPRNEVSNEFPNLTYFNLGPRPPAEEYLDIHPPSYVYALYAEKLAKFIVVQKNKTF